MTEPVFRTYCQSSAGDRWLKDLSVGQPPLMIDVRDVGVVSDGVTMLSPISFSSIAGVTTIIRGRNGSGKSTLLRVLAGHLAPSSGTASIAGRPVSRPDRQFRRRVASMLGLPPMARDLTVRDHVSLVAATWFKDAAERSAIAESVMNASGMMTLGRRFPHELSSGQRQLCGLSLVLARPFDVLILDEPEQRLDDEHLQRLVELLLTLRGRGVTLVVATHSSALANAIADITLTLTAST